MGENWVTTQAVVIAKTGPGEFHAIGEVVSHAAFPTVGIVTEDGQKITWAEHLCEEATTQEAIEYWRQRAIRAEQQRASANARALRAQDQAAEALSKLEDKLR